MKYIYILVSFLFIEITGFAQMPAGARPSGGNMNLGHFYGKMVDANKKGIEGITLQIKGSKFDPITKKSTESILGTTLTAPNGDFSFENLPLMGNFKLSITGVGYKKIEKQVSFGIKMGGGQNMQEMMAMIDKDLGNIRIEESATDLQSVTVTSTAKPQFEMGIDRKVFNVDKNLTSTGQTAVEVMKNIPNLNVDIDGNVTLRNAAPTLLIDNRPTTLTMDQIPADIIDKVEIITNPSAKYDATGGNAGILNIVLKKNRKNGYNGGIRTGIDMRGKLNGGTDLNLRDSKFNFSLNANVNGRKSIGTSESDRTILGAAVPTSVLNNSSNTNNGSFDFYRGGIDYFADNRNTFSLYANVMQGNFDNTGSQIIDSIKNSFRNSDNLLNNSSFHFLNKGGQLSYKHLFAEKGHELAADFNYNEADNNNWSNVSYQKAKFLDQNSIGSGNNKNYSSNVDYAKELSPNTKFEAGGKYNYRSEFNLSNQFRNGALLKSISNQYRYSETVFAGYVNLNTKIEKWSFQLGLRAENRSYEGHLLNNKGTDSLPYSTKYPISLFPSAFINYKLDDQQDFQLNYSKRISPPNFFQLLPFPNFSDPQNINIGNPALKPQFTHSFEIAYNNAYTKGSNFLATAYYKYSTDLITNYVYRGLNPINNIDSVYFSSSINANTAVVYGLELSNKTAITKWWDMNLSFNLFKSAITATIPGQNVNNDLTSWFSKMNNTFKIGKGYSFQFSGQYQAKTILPPGGNSAGGGGRGGPPGGGFGGPQSTAQGYNFPSYDFDMALKKDWTLTGGRTASLSLSVNDVFKTRINKTYSESQFFIQNVARIRDQQIFRLNFSYRFGKFDVNLLKRKNNKMEEGGGGMDQMPQ
jgi:outer membrane receptor protein involved in Fe transport